MNLQVENSIWHAFDYLSMENGKQSANKSKLKVSVIYGWTRINDIAIAMSYSSRADPGLRVAFKYLNV